ncbi:MAG: hypothetical protein FJY17_05770 [Bacteroidetes bacterium]|nr:hypothetical protein [Bacteroidota bacterium]
MGWNFFKKENQDKDKIISVVALKSIDYPSLVILAWAKAVEGNEELQNWLKDNGVVIKKWICTPYGHDSSGGRESTSGKMVVGAEF